MRVEGDIVIERPAEEVFDFVAEERNEPQYNPRMTRAEMISPGADRGRFAFQVGDDQHRPGG